MNRTVLAALLSHWRRHPLQLATLLIGLALATALWTGVQALNAEARASYAEAADAIGQSELPVIDGPLTVENYVALRRAGWMVTPVVEGLLIVGDLPLRITGIDALTAPPATVPSAFLSGDAPMDAPPLFVGPETLAALSGMPEAEMLGELRLAAAMDRRVHLSAGRVAGVARAA